MKFLQTGDLHLGKSFYQYSLIEDQAHILSQLTNILINAQKTSDPYDALMIPGDIYDRSVPPAEAVTLFSKFLTELHSALPNLHIFLLSGNHDSAERLSFAKDLLSSNNIHICTDFNTFTKPIIVNNVAVYQIPFLQPGCIKSSDCEDLFIETLRTQQELALEAVNQIIKTHKKNYKDLQSILCAHLLTIGGLRSESERISVGTAEQVDSSIFKSFSYTALGHLHSFQKVGQNAFYSGSPLSYSFDESDCQKYFLSITIGEQLDNSKKIESNDNFILQKIPVEPLHECKKIKTSFDKIYSDKTFDNLSNCFIQVICTDKVPITNSMALLRKKFPYILSFSYETQENSFHNTNTFTDRKKLLNGRDEDSLLELYNAYINDIYGPEQIATDSLTEKKKELFSKFCIEAQKEVE